MADDNTCAVLHGPGDIRIEKRKSPVPKDNEVLIRMGFVGICGSDIKYWKEGRCGIFTLETPMVMGHEGSGTVVQVGSGVKHLKPGDRVAIEPGIPCRTCRLCKTGKYNICPDVVFCATPPVDGNLCQLFTHPADFCYKLPDDVTLQEGALLEPLAVAVYSCRRGDVTMGTTVLICGAGPVGILTMLVAKKMGASKVIISDIDENRLAVAKEFGADDVMHVSTKDPREMATAVVTTLGCQPDVSFECSGVDFSLATAIHATYPGGCVVTVGRGANGPGIPLNAAATKEVDIKGIFRYANCYPAALAFVCNSGVDLKRLVTHTFALPETVQAFETANTPQEKAIKVLIRCDEDRNN